MSLARYKQKEPYRVKHEERMTNASHEAPQTPRAVANIGSKQSV